jgi:peroxiredoxin
MALFAGCASNGLAPTGQPAPGFSLATPAGEQIELAKLKGKVVVLDFWATWCVPCQQSLPHLQKIAADTDLAQRGLVVLAVNEQEKAGTIRPFVDAKHFTFTVVQDSDGSTAQDYSVNALPTTIVIGRDGLIQAVITGWAPDSADRIEQAVNSALIVKN